MDTFFNNDDEYHCEINSATLTMTMMMMMMKMTMTAVTCFTNDDDDDDDDDDDNANHCQFCYSLAVPSALHVITSELFGTYQGRKITLRRC